MNDPNGLIHINGVHHLFYQYNPASTDWGDIHWGHASSRDFLRWKHHAPALFPDRNGLGIVASGSAVVDTENSSRLGRVNGPPPVVAMFSHFTPDGRQVQSLAYSDDDEAFRWSMFEENPVLERNDLPDFRDPKVFWHAQSGAWVMVLAAGEEVLIYRSDNLKSWTETHRFGRGVGAHGAVWETPDLFPVGAIDGLEQLWVLVVSIQGCAPNGGSGTQYFVGRFDGGVFEPTCHRVRWLGLGPDDYAGVTWSGLPDPSRRVSIGWMSNWDYAAVVPTEGWRGTMTLPRELEWHSESPGHESFLSVQPIKELLGLRLSTALLSESGRARDLEHDVFEVEATGPGSGSWSIEFDSQSGDLVAVGFDASLNSWYVDARQTFGDTTGLFRRVVRAPAAGETRVREARLFFDRTSVELFADSGRTTLTSLVFPLEPIRSVVPRNTLEVRLHILPGEPLGGS